MCLNSIPLIRLIYQISLSSYVLSIEAALVQYKLCHRLIFHIRSNESVICIPEIIKQILICVSICQIFLKRECLMFISFLKMILNDAKDCLSSTLLFMLYWSNLSLHYFPTGNWHSAIAFDNNFFLSDN